MTEPSMRFERPLDPYETRALALHTTVCFVLLSSGIFLARPDRGFMQVVTRSSLGGVLARWLHYYNEHRRHSALNGQPPLSRVVQSDDLLRVHS